MGPSRAVVLQVGGIGPWRWFWGARGRKKQGGRQRGEATQRVRKLSTTTTNRL